MAQFYLIQRGHFNKTGKFLTGKDGVVSLDYMGAAEFEWGALPHSFRRIMYYFSSYDTFSTGIFSPENEELMIFARKDKAKNIIDAIRTFIASPYKLKEYSELEKVPFSRVNDSVYHQRYTDFWWEIENADLGDWMAFLSSKRNIFYYSILNDYTEWWMQKNPKEREEEYKKSVRNW